MRVLVTGGGGFLGKAIAVALLEKGIAVRSISRGDYPQLRELGIETVQGNLADKDKVIEAAKDCEAIFHVAAKPGIWGDEQEYRDANLTGTENVLAALEYHKIDRLVYTSSPCIVFDGKSHAGVTEDTPYTDHFFNHYQRTKAEAEAKVLSANSEKLATVSLRPHLIWGPGDNHLVPRIIARARAGQLRIVGDGQNLVDSVYIDNVVDAHIQAFEKLKPGSNISGKSYFITNGEPMPLSQLINKILAAAGEPPVTKKIPAPVAYFAGAVFEFVYGLFGWMNEPRMTRFLALELSCSHWYDLTAAKRDLDYRPAVTIEQGLKKLEEYLRK